MFFTNTNIFLTSNRESYSITISDHAHAFVQAPESKALQIRRQIWHYNSDDWPSQLELFSYFSFIPFI